MDRDSVTSRRRGGPTGWFVIALLILPVLELAVIIQVGQLIGAWPTIILLVVESALGAWIVRREGAGAWRALNDSMARGRMPGREMADAALILVGGTLLLTPGFVTDILGFLLVIPPSRAVARRLLARYVRRRFTVVATSATTTVVQGQVVEGDVVDDAAPPGDTPPRTGE